MVHANLRERQGDVRTRVPDSVDAKTLKATLQDNVSQDSCFYDGRTTRLPAHRKGIQRWALDSQPRFGGIFSGRREHEHRRIVLCLVEAGSLWYFS